MHYLDQKLLAEAHARRLQAKKKLFLARQMLDDAKVEYQEIDQAVSTFERLAKEHDDFSDSAHGAVG